MLVVATSNMPLAPPANLPLCLTVIFPKTRSMGHFNYYVYLLHDLLFQLDYQIGINLYLTEASTLRRSRETFGLKPS